MARRPDLRLRRLRCPARPGRERRHHDSWATTTRAGASSRAATGRSRRFFGRHAESVNGTLVKYYYLGDRLVATRSDPTAASAAPGADRLDPLRRLAAGPPRRSRRWGPCCCSSRWDRSRSALGVRVARSGALGSSLLVWAISLPVVVPSLGCVEHGRHPSLPSESSREPDRDQRARRCARAPVSTFGLREDRGASTARGMPPAPTRRIDGSSRATRRTRAPGSSMREVASTTRIRRAS